MELRCMRFSPFSARHTSHTSQVRSGECLQKGCYAAYSREQKRLTRGPRRKAANLAVTFAALQGRFSRHLRAMRIRRRTASVIRKGGLAGRPRVEVGEVFGRHASAYRRICARGASWDCLSRVIMRLGEGLLLRQCTSHAAGWHSPNSGCRPHALRQNGQLSSGSQKRERTIRALYLNIQVALPTRAHPLWQMRNF
jgi:hypothetical protein